MRWIKILLALAVLRIVLMAVVPVFEPSEARYAAISANMARTGDFVTPRFTHNNEYQSFDGKPPLVFQAGGVFCRVFGTERPYSLQFAVRLFPFLSAVVLLFIVRYVVTLISDRERGNLAMAVCATSAAFFAASGISMTDMTLTCCVAGALLFYRAFIERAGVRHMLAVGALLGAGMITKGPVAIVMFGLPVFVDAIVNKRWRTLFNWRWIVFALPVFLLVAVPWFVLMEARNPGSTWYFFYNENFLRFVSHDYGDKYGAGREAFRGVSVLWAIVATLPWTPFAWKCRAFRDFFFISLASITGFWCLTSRVLVYYLFPVIPLFAAYLALYGNRNHLKRMFPFAALVSALVVAGALVGGMTFSDKMLGARQEFTFKTNHYAHEFYHGTKSAAELAVAKAEYETWRERRRMEKAARKAAKEAAK